MIVTLRLSDNEITDIEALKIFFGEKTAAKAILQATEKYLLIHKSRNDYQDAFNTCRNELNELKNIIKLKLELNSKIELLITEDI